jgi:hypothetical protein
VQPPAVEAPPPHLRAPEDDVKPTKPARRRSPASPAPKLGGELASPKLTALPAGTAAKPKRVPRAKTAPEPVSEAKPSTRVARKKPAAPAPAAEAKPKRAAAPAKKVAPAPVKSTARAKKAPAAAAKPAVKKGASTRKTSSSKSPVRKKKS